MRTFRSLGADVCQSLPLRGAWIEMIVDDMPIAGSGSLPLRGAWIEILNFYYVTENGTCRSPCGERGLKLKPTALRQSRLPSLPLRGAWIEMRSPHPRVRNDVSRSPCGERGLKYLEDAQKTT